MIHVHWSLLVFIPVATLFCGYILACILKAGSDADEQIEEMRRE